MDTESDWSCNANDAVHITIVQPGEKKPNTLSTFHPQFTYPIFGDEETIFGYKGLIIRLRLASHDLRPHLHISYDDKFKAVEDTEAVNLLEALKPWAPEEAFVTLPDFEKAVQNEDARSFKPPGKLLQKYTAQRRNYEIWAGSLADPEVRRLLDRIQICVSFFIEAGTPVPTNDPEWTLERWTVYFLYEIVTAPTPTGSKYSIAGYATTYRWWFYQSDPSRTTHVTNKPFPMPPVKVSQLPARLRIAQFLILPPHQHSGHGAHLYSTIHSTCMDDPTIVELTVEDPSESFDVLRDISDYLMLRPEFRKHHVNINPDPYKMNSSGQRPRRVPTTDLLPIKLLNDIRKSYKIAPTQFAHILEMFLLSQIPLEKRRAGGVNMSRLLIKKFRVDDPGDRRYYWWRILTKQRLYKRSKDMLIQLDLNDRLEKLEETVDNVEQGYESLLQDSTARERVLKAEYEETTKTDESHSTVVLEIPGGETVRNLGRNRRGKRRLTVEEDESEDEEIAKRTKI